MYEFFKVKGTPRTWSVISYGMEVGTIYADRMGYYVFTLAEDFMPEDVDTEEVEDIKREFEAFLYKPRNYAMMKFVRLYVATRLENGKEVPYTYPCPLSWIKAGYDIQVPYAIHPVWKLLKTGDLCPIHLKCRIRVKG